MTELSILIFTWNASGLKICESSSPQLNKHLRTGFSKFYKKPCVIPDFFPEIKQAIQDNEYDLLIFNTEGEDSSDTFFHSVFLPEELETHKQLFNESLKSVSVEVDRTPETGEPSGSSIRLSVYCKKSLKITVQKKFMEDKVMSLTQGERTSGCVVCYLKHSLLGKIAIMSVYLPPGKEVIPSKGEINYHESRQITTCANTMALLTFFDKFIKGREIDFTILAGNMDFDIVKADSNPKELLSTILELTHDKLKKVYTDYDELAQLLRTPCFRGVKEGVDGTGIDFHPSWKMKQNRKDCKEEKIKCYTDEDKGMGWHERILYRSLNPTYKMKCDLYGKILSDVTSKSTGDAILASFKIEK